MFRPGDTIDAWIVERMLGSGGMGSVYLCRNRGARRILAAVKVLDARLDHSPKVRARFVREAELLFAMQHPNIVKVRNVRMDAAPPYLEMEFVEGPSLEAVLARGPLMPGDAVDLAAQVAEALAYVHARGVFHRDVKPSNVVLQPGGGPHAVAKLVDFGIAAEAGSNTVSEAGQALGSAAYVPPEWLGGGVDPARWDLYALGVVLYELLTGAQPFAAPDSVGPTQRFVATLIAKKSAPALDPVGAPEPLRALVRALTAPDPDERPSDAAAVGSRLRELDGLERDPSFVSTRVATVLRSDTDAPQVNSTWSGLAASAPGAPAAEGVARALHDDSPPRSTWSGTDPGGVAGGGKPPAPESAERRRGSLLLPPGPLEPIGSADPPAPRPSRLPLVVAALALLLAAAAALLRPPPEAAERPVILTFAAAAASLYATWDGAPAPVVADGDGARVEFAAVRPGRHALEVRQGDGCAAEAVPAWCGVTRVSVNVPEGVDAHRADVPLPALPERDVVVSEAGGALFAFHVEDVPSPEGTFGAVNLRLRAGRHVASATGQGCPPPPCGADCPPTCARWDGTLDVPWGEGAWATSVALATRTTPPVASAPAVADPTRAAATATTPPRTEAAPSAEPPTTTRAIGLRDLAAWLAEHPDWQPDAARANGRADADYLKGWTGATPPRLDDGPALATNHGLATAYCAAHGGLAAVTTAPTRWTDTTRTAWHEWRTDGLGGVVSLQSSGTASPPVAGTKTGKYTGFRCARP